MAIVYKHTNLFNGKCYIGVTTRTMEDRWVEHVSKRYRMSTYFAFALREFDESWWEHEILFNGSESDCYKQEIYYINKFDTLKSGYNFVEGGRSRRTPESVRRKISGRHNYQFKGYYVTPNGKFESLNSAATSHNCSFGKIKKRCISDNSRILTLNAVRQSDDLDDIHVGLTFKQLGWGFQNAGNTSTWNA